MLESGELRDELAYEFCIIGLEMEGARGVGQGPLCYYNQRHLRLCRRPQDKDWQAFAAATATSVTKAALGEGYSLEITRLCNKINCLLSLRLV